jgi:hypothetical protein
MKSKRNILLLILVVLPFSLICINGVSAYNFDSPVEVGDILIYKYSSTSTTYGNVTHMEVNITEIVDVLGTTVIRGISTGSQDGGNTFDYLPHLSDLATLQNYSLDPIDLIDDLHLFVVPGTQVGNYADEIEPLLSAGTATSTNNGLGIKIENCPDINKTLIFNEDGIITKYYNQDINIYELDLFSINGERYFIPGYPVLLVFSFTFIGILAVYFTKIHKNRLK